MQKNLPKLSKMPPKFKRKLKKILPRLKFPLLVLGIFFLIGLIIVFRPKLKPSFWWSIIFTNPLKQNDGLTNILLLGIAGGTHEGADLTDTMILASVDQKTGQVTLVSLPRDIWSTTLSAKINSAYHYGEEKRPGGGFLLAKTIAEEVTGLPAHYTVKIDLQGLKKIIDLLGGLEIEVEKTLDDYQFPIEGKENDPCGGDPEYKCRFQHVHFEAGKQLLTGERAIIYIRSRHAEGEEGTDFARDKRQQKLILALKTKILSPAVLLHPFKLIALYKAVDEMIDSDVPQDQLPYFWKMIAIGFRKIKTLSLEEFLITPPTWQYQGQWVLIPRTGNFGEIQEYLREQTLK